MFHEMFHPLLHGTFSVLCFMFRYLVNSGIINLPADVFQNLGSLQAL